VHTKSFLYGCIAEVTNTEPVVGGHANTVRGVGYQPTEHHVLGPRTSWSSSTMVLDRPWTAVWAIIDVETVDRVGVCGSHELNRPDRIRCSLTSSCSLFKSTIKLEIANRAQLPPGWCIEFRQKIYFIQKLVLSIAKFGEDRPIWNHDRAISLQVEDFQYGGFDLELWPWPVKSATCETWNLAQMLNVCAKFHENTTSITNKQTNQPTNKHAWSQYLLTKVNRTARPRSWLTAAFTSTSTDNVRPTLHVRLGPR